MNATEETPEQSSILPTASELVLETQRRGARVFRMREVCVFAITNDPATAEWLLKQGALPFKPFGTSSTWEYPLGAYKRARDEGPEWDLYIHIIPVAGDESVWEAAGRSAPTVEGADFR